MKNRIKIIIIILIALNSGQAKAQTTDLQPDEENTIAIFERVAPSVVFIKNAALQLDWLSADVYEIPQGAGSGFIWDEKGHIITNFHVIYQAGKIEVNLSNQKSYPAQVVGVSPDHDLAVLKIEAPISELIPLLPGSSKDLKVGQKVLVVGNPFGLDHSLSTGVVSSLGRSIRSLTGRKIYDVIQTDAAINPGNSGGPLLDSAGRLIGVATSIYSPSGAYAGVGFAIPVDIVKRIVPQLIEFKRIKRIGLGVSLIPDNIRERFGIEGAIIMDIGRNSSAEKAGLRATRRDRWGTINFGDVILEINGEKVKENEDLINNLERNGAVGRKVKIKYLRDEKIYETESELQEL